MKKKNLSAEAAILLVTGCEGIGGHAQGTKKAPLKETDPSYIPPLVMRYQRMRWI